MEILNYYIASMSHPSCLLDFKYLKDLFHELRSLNWKSKTNEALTFVCFINKIVDKGTDSGQIGLDMLFDLLISDTQLLVKLMGIVEDTCFSSTLNIFGKLVEMILRLFINLTFCFR